MFKVKTENSHHIKGYIEAGELETGNLARTLQTDCASEYESAWFTKYLKDKGIHQEFSAPHCQSQNGLAERVIGTLSDMVNCMLVESELQRKYWGYAVFFLFEADFIQLVVLNLSHLNYIKLCLFLTSNKR